jgi:hypothetical protein
MTSPLLPLLAYHVLLPDGRRRTLCHQHYQQAIDRDEALLVSVSRPLESCDVCEARP